MLCFHHWLLSSFHRGKVTSRWLLSYCAGNHLALRLCVSWGGKRYTRAVIALVVCVFAFYDNPTFSCDFEKSSYLMLCHQDICIKNVLGTKVRNKHIMQLLMTWERDSWDRVLRWHSCVLTLPELSDFLKWCSQLNSALLFNMGGGDDVLEHLTTSS